MTARETDRVDHPNPSAVIYDHFRGLIASGRLGIGERLPSVRQTAADLGVSAGTAARAYKQLERDGLVTSRTGAGTRVATGASPLPESLVVMIRKLADLTAREQVDPNDVVTSLRAELNG